MMAEFWRGIAIGLGAGLLVRPTLRLIVAMIDERREARVATWDGKERKEMMIRGDMG